MDTESKKPGNYLSIDGGPSGLPALYTLEEIFSRLQDDLKLDEELVPCRWFDVVIGTGRGAIVALLLGKLGLTVSKAIEAYMTLEPLLSVKPAQGDKEREENTKEFKRAFLEVLSEANIKGDAPMLSETGTKTIICASNTANVSVVHLIRSYPIRGARAPACTILEAACACVAFPNQFLPTIIGSGHKRMTLIDAVAGYANPTKELMKEAQKIFGEDAEVATIFSVGAGKWSVQATTERERGIHLDDALKQGVIGGEQVHEDLQSRLLQAAIYFRFNIERELGNQPDAILAHISAYLGETVTSSRLDEVIRRIQTRPSGTKLRDINSVTAAEIKLKPRPRVVPHFIGREDILEAMRYSHLSDHQTQQQLPAITILSGIGGLGKTQTALKFALEFEEKYPGVPVYFLDASASEKLRTDLETVIRSRGTAYHSKSYEDTLGWLATELKNWLVILDNADDPNVDLVHYIPQCGHGHVIITSRNATLAALVPDTSHALETLPIPDATTLLLTASRYPNEEENRSLAENIAIELGCLPLALAHAAGYIFVHRCLETYLELYRRNREKLLASTNSRLLHDYRISVAMTIAMSLGKLSERARDILRLFAYLQATSIPRAIIAKAAERRFRRVERTDISSMSPETLEQADVLMKIFCPGGEWSDFEFNESIQECLQYSLLQLTMQNNDKFYSMHVLVQLHLQQEADVIQDHQSRRLCVRLLGSAITIGNKYEFFAFDRLLLPHIRLLQIEDVIEAGDHLGISDVLDDVGDVQLSLLHREKCVEIWRQIPGKEEHTIGAMEYLAISYGQMGKNQAALELYEQVLSVRKRFLGPEHQDTVQTMGNLGTSYMQLGKYKEAQELLEQTLSVYKRLFGPEHQRTIRTMGNLAISYKNMGKIQAALELEEEALSLQNRLFGPEHPDTMRNMGNLVVSYRKLGKHQAALEMGEEVLSLQKKLLGSEHPHTLLTMSNLAISYADMGKSQAAMELEEEALSLRKRRFGLEHPDTLRSMGNLALHYNDVGKNQEALELEEEVLSLRTRLLGLQHPDTLGAMWNLLATYRTLDRQSQRLELLMTAVPAYEAAEQFGRNHPTTIKLRQELDELSVLIILSSFNSGLMLYTA